MGRLAALLLVALATLAPAAPAAAIELDDYRARLERALDALDASPPDPTGAAETLAAIESVSLPDGTAVAVDLTSVIAMLRAEPPRIDAASASLAALLDELDLAERGATSDSGARAALEVVLAREEFQPPPEDDSFSLWREIGRAVNAVLEPLFEWLSTLLGGGGGEAGPATYIVAAIGVAVIVGIVAFAARGVRRSLAPRVVTLDAGAAEEHYTSAQARAEAERLFAAGDFRAALRMLYLATLIRWEEAGRLRFERSLTNREVVARVTVQGDASLLEQLSPLVERFDRVWYGSSACTSDDYAAFASLANRAWEAA